ncbi:unnamed protein product [Vitrella brassicaformis CCMP3155]|uniref:Uncharacterized protein n=1 Tax=Vitrella brassicaformis (strain CCMP3155) TaxID=1169540 RepID=A0A0G4EES4_VITBC|nr:unnamed protein product [Vitrella brassicaformis CCMP3155]|eukprot:CEL93878.1 unnamed protein product [Vitrella brassicaformis CCMP3155]
MSHCPQVSCGPWRLKRPIVVPQSVPCPASSRKKRKGDVVYVRTTKPGGLHLYSVPMEMRRSDAALKIAQELLWTMKQKYWFTPNYWLTIASWDDGTDHAFRPRVAPHARRPETNTNGACTICQGWLGFSAPSDASSGPGQPMFPSVARLSMCFWLLHRPSLRMFPTTPLRPCTSQHRICTCVSPSFRHTALHCTVMYSPLMPPTRSINFPDQAPMYGPVGVPPGPRAMSPPSYQQGFWYAQG